MIATMSADDTNQPDATGPAIVRGIVIGLPVSLVGLTLAVWAITDLDVVDSLVTALLPGVLLGAFGGGFAGMARTMTE
ncbi:MAG TPA: hypothetical protein VMS99_11910 [Acidimicrobiia bacterium]|nr:hypothetical protein [Acidimicrobiia bacterium]